MSELKITLDDPFIQRIDKERAQLRGRSAWTYEAARRMATHNGVLPYFTDEPTWAWTRAMLDVLADFPVSGDPSKCRLDPKGPGFGVHVYSNPRLGPIDLIESNLRAAPKSATRRYRTNDADGKCVASGWAYLDILRIPRDGHPEGYISTLTKMPYARNAENDHRHHHAYHDLAVKMQALLKARPFTSLMNKLPATCAGAPSES